MMDAATRRPFRCTLAALMAGLLAMPAAAQDPPLDDMQQAVVDSLETEPRTTAPELLEAALIATDVEATAVAEAYVARLQTALQEAGDGGAELLADLGEQADAAALGRLERLVAPRQPAVGRLVAAIREAAGLRRRDPARLAQAAADLDDPDGGVRRAAAARLAGAREDALPVLVPLLGTTDPAGARTRALARDVVALLGPAARQPLLAWLASEDVADWPGIAAALDASGATDFDAFLLAPARVADLPAEVRAAAQRVLRDRAVRRGADPAGVPPAPRAARELLAARLDRLLSPAGLPTVDHLLVHPVTDEATATAALAGPGATVERLLWDSEARRFRRVRIPPRGARALDAMHVARDLAALGARDDAAVQLVLLARIEARLTAAGDAATALERVPVEELRATLAGPDGFSAETAAAVLEAAVERGLWEAAAAVAAALGADPSAPLPPAARDALARAIAVPDPALQFTAARTLALAGGPPPYPGSSRVLEALLHAATSTGVDRAVVAHPDAAIAQELAAGVSRFGYEPVRVSSGRAAVFAARGSADTVLVLLAARTVRPTASETVQFLQQQGLGAVPPVLLVVDPSDDDGRGAFLTRLLIACRDLEGVTIVDRLESFFAAVPDPDGGAAGAPPRFPDALVQVAGPAAVAPATRATAARVRLARAREALGLLARLARAGWDASPALGTALAALDHAPLHAPAVSLLATLDRAEAQQALAREALRAEDPAAARRLAIAALATSVERRGVLLETGQVRGLLRMYNHPAGSASRDAAEAVLEVIETAGAGRAPSPHAAAARPTR